MKIRNQVPRSFEEKPLDSQTVAYMLQVERRVSHNRVTSYGHTGSETPNDQGGNRWVDVTRMTVFRLKFLTTTPRILQPYHDSTAFLKTKSNRATSSYFSDATDARKSPAEV